MSHLGVINPLDFKWLLSVDKAPTNIDFEKTLYKNSLKFDKDRMCELETLIHVWKDEKSLTKRKVVDEFRACFSSNFLINSISYDFGKLYIFKAKMVAMKVGVLKKNKYVDFEVEIKRSSDEITNETMPLGLLNSAHKKLEIREKSNLVFYFTDIYV